MGKAYDEIMDQVEVTEEMQERILSNIRTQKICREKKILRYRRKALQAAAGLLLVLTVSACAVRIMRKDAWSLPEKETEPEPVFVGNGIEECPSVETLSAKVGFPVTDLSGLPFVVDHTEYLSYWGDMAEINYQGADETACYRKSEGEEDNSGDYNEYAEVQTLEADGFSVTVKGEDGIYRLAVWQKDGYSYSLSLEKGANAETFVKLASENQ